MGGRYITSEVADALAGATLPAAMETPHTLRSNREVHIFRKLAGENSAGLVIYAVIASVHPIELGLPSWAAWMRCDSADLVAISLRMSPVSTTRDVADLDLFYISLGSEILAVEGNQL